MKHAHFPLGNITFNRVARPASTVVVGTLALGKHSFSYPALLGVSATPAVLLHLHSDNNTGGVERSTCALSPRQGHFYQGGAAGIRGGGRDARPWGAQLLLPCAFGRVSYARHFTSPA